MIEIKHKDTGEVLLRLMGKSLAGRNLCRATLVGANLDNMDMSDVDFSRADLRLCSMIDTNLTATSLESANLKGANLHGANLTFSDLGGANLENASLIASHLDGSNLTGAILKGAHLGGALLKDVYTNGTNVRRARLHETAFILCYELHKMIGIDSIQHLRRSSIDRETLRASIHSLPDIFLQGCGYTQHEIDYLRSLYINSPIRFFSCFISHGEPDLPFAERLLADLRQQNVSCWHYKQDMRGGKDWEDQINRAIKVHDKLILICSRSSIYRKNVVAEILHAVNEERATSKQKLFPIMLDDHILSKEMLDDEIRHVKAGLWPGVWVEEVKRKHIPDFSGWDTDNKKYQTEFKKLLEALQDSSSKA